MDLTPDNLATLCRDAEALCRRVAPADLDGRGCYVLVQSQLPAELREHSPCAGAYTAPCMDVVLMDTIGGRWQGRGFCAVVNDADIAAVPPQHRREAFVAAVLHELAHAVADGYEWRPSAATRSRRRRQELVRCLAAVVADPARFERPALPFDAGHGARWLRAALHLVARAQCLGERVAECAVVDPIFYGIEYPYRYDLALGVELDGPADRPLREILDTDPPAAFAALWADTEARHTDPARRLLPWDEGGAVRPPPVPSP